MKLNLKTEKTSALTPDSTLGWNAMPKFGSGYLDFIASNPTDDDFEPAAALSDDTNEFLAALPLAPAGEESDEGWASVSSKFKGLLHESFWNSISNAAGVRTILA